MVTRNLPDEISAKAPLGSAIWTFRSGYMYTAPAYASDTAVAMTQNEFRGALFAVSKATTFDQIAIEVTTAAASAVVRLGIYSALEGNWPGPTVVLDAGTVDASGTGVKTISISTTLQPGMYILGACLQGASGVSVRGRSASLLRNSQGTTLANANESGFIQTAGAGALNSSPTWASHQQSFPKVGLRAA